MAKAILGQGPLKCKIAIIGEAPGVSEEIEGKPFVGHSGSLLNSKLSLVGLKRQDCYITNISKYRPSSLYKESPESFNKKPENDNDLSIFWAGTRPTAMLLQMRQNLLEELDKLETNVIVALGANALWALTGESKIGKWRGTVMSCPLPSGRSIKVIGSYHPAAVLRQWDFGAVLQADLAKAVRHSAFPEPRTPERKLLIKPSSEEVIAFLNKEEGSDLSFDIETSPRGIECISFSWNPHVAMSVPTTVDYWGSVEQLKYIVEQIDKVMQRPDIVKVGQNMSYDIQYMARIWGILPAKPWFDTMIAQHSCYSELPKGLGFLASLYTDEPYYKDDLKTWMAGGSGLDSLWRYNANDAAVTEEVKLKLEDEMKELGTRKTFDFMMELLEPLLFAMLKGLRIDADALKEMEASVSKSLEEMEARFEEKFPGVNPHSATQVKKLAYTTLGLKPVTKKGKASVDKDALEKLADKSPALEEVAKIRAERVIRSTYLRVPLDAVDGRLRFSLNSTGTETGRLSSNASVFYCGNNLQNWPKRVRSLVIPDEDRVFTEADLKGAEAMIVAYLSEDLPLIKLFEHGGNIHNFTAIEILRLADSVAEIKADKERCHVEQRDNESIYSLAKRIRHGGNYKMGWKTLMQNLKCSAADAKKYLAAFHANSPNISLWHTEVEEQLQRTRTLTTPLGRKRIFFGRWGDSLIKEAIAFVPQETCASVLNTGLIKVYNNLCTHPNINFKTQTHDSILLEHPACLTEMVHTKLHELMAVPLTIRGRTFSIPIDIETGPNWGTLKGA